MRFLLVDRISSCDPEGGISGFKNAALSEDYFEWHFPERPIVPGMLILEAFAQLAGWREARTSDSAAGSCSTGSGRRATTTSRAPATGSSSRLERTAAEGDRRVWRGESRVAGTRGAVVEFEGLVVPLADLEAEATARRTFSALFGGGADASERPEGSGR